MKKRQFKKYVKNKLHINTSFKSSLEKKQYMHNLKIWNKLCFNGQDDSNMSNSLVLGKSIPSNVYHPWDNLKVCKKCGTYPFMEENMVDMKVEHLIGFYAYIVEEKQNFTVMFNC